jgi:3'(2'), 5'-bisphosphate nucleotidase
MRTADDASPAALARIAQIASGAGVEIMRVYGTAVETSRKADASPLTAADLAAHRHIDAELRAWDRTIPVISEESAAATADVRSRWDRWWLVDPLDGTKEFLAGNGEFTVNIALMAAGEPVLGVVHAPALDLTYAAGRGLGAWRHEGGRPALRILSTRWRAGRPARIVESRSHPSRELEAFLDTIAVAERIAVGSSLKFCRVAEGAADLYPRFGPMREWDVAAGDCIYRNSAVVGERISPLVYNTPDLRVPGFVLGDEDGAGREPLRQTA